MLHSFSFPFLEKRCFLFIVPTLPSIILRKNDGMLLPAMEEAESSNSLSPVRPWVAGKLGTCPEPSACPWPGVPSRGGTLLPGALWPRGHAAGTSHPRTDAARRAKPAPAGPAIGIGRTLVPIYFIPYITHPDNLGSLSHLLPTPGLQEQPPAPPRPSRAGATPVSRSFLPCPVPGAHGAAAAAGRCGAESGHRREAGAEQRCPRDARGSPVSVLVSVSLPPVPVPVRAGPGSGRAFIAAAAATRPQRPLRARPRTALRAPPAPAGTRGQRSAPAPRHGNTARGHLGAPLLPLPARLFVPG